MREIRVMGRALDSAVETLSAAESAKAQRDLEKVQNLQQLYARGEQLVDLLTSRSIDQLVSVLKQGRATETD
jgi:hypothetical protein